VAKLSLVCWKCGAGLDEVPQPLSKYAECLACRAELHVCRMCRFYDTSVAQACREPMADEVKDKTRANFCDYFEPRPDAWTGQDGPSARNDALAALFGDDEEGDTASEASGGEQVEALNALFGDPAKKRD